jgi:hypothetical protein
MDAERIKRLDAATCNFPPGFVFFKLSFLSAEWCVAQLAQVATIPPLVQVTGAPLGASR